MAKKQKLETFLIPRLRRISLWWRGRHEALKDARVYVKVGVFKNGNDKIGTFYKCAFCEDLFDKKEIQVDHIQDIANIDGFKDWNSYIPALFCEKDNLQTLCKACHISKTEYEKSLRNKTLDKSHKK